MFAFWHRFEFAHVYSPNLFSTLFIAVHKHVSRLQCRFLSSASWPAIALMGELLLLPPNLSHREWVKFAGLDPKAFDSGKSVHKKARLSKAGNRHIRSALYMPALSAKQHDPHVKAYFDHLVTNGKKPLQAVCAVMRKLLHAIHGMLKHDKPFDNTRFTQSQLPPNNQKTTELGLILNRVSTRLALGISHVFTRPGPKRDGGDSV